MADNVYAVSEIVGSSKDSIEDAIQGALSRARKTLRNLVIRATALLVSVGKPMT